MIPVKISKWTVSVFLDIRTVGKSFWLSVTLVTYGFCIIFSSGESDKSHSNSSFDMTKVSPGAYAAQPEALPTSSSVYAERMTMDISMLKKQYRKLRERQQQAHIILTCEYLILYFISTSTKIRRSIMLRHYSLADLQRKFSGASPYGTKFFHFHTHFHRKAPMSEVHAPPPHPLQDGSRLPPYGKS